MQQISTDPITVTFPEPPAVRRHARNVRGRAGDHPRFGPHQHPASVPSWPVPGEISPKERPALPSQRFPANASSGPLNSGTAGAYRPGMSWLIKTLPPNPRLQRTRLRAPLSRKSLGRSKTKKEVAICNALSS